MEEKFGFEFRVLGFGFWVSGLGVSGFALHSLLTIHH